jgi:hypothetical protein
VEVPLPCGRQTEGTASQQEELGGDGGVKGEALGDFHFHFHFREKVKVKVKVILTLSLLLFFLNLCQCLRRA